MREGKPFAWRSRALELIDALRSTAAPHEADAPVVDPGAGDLQELPFLAVQIHAGEVIVSLVHGLAQTPEKLLVLYRVRDPLRLDDPVALQCTLLANDRPESPLAGYCLDADQALHYGESIDLEGLTSEAMRERIAARCEAIAAVEARLL